MQKVNFHYCCGMVEIGNFGWGAQPLTQQTMANLLQEARAADKGFAICTTIAAQKAATTLLRQTGWKVLRTFTNPNTGSRVTMWGRSTDA